MSNAPRLSISIPLHAGITALLLWLPSGCASTVSGTDPGADTTTELAPTPGSGDTGGSGETASGSEAPPSSLPLLPGLSSNSSLTDHCEERTEACHPPQTSEHLPGRPLPEVQTVVTETITPQQIYDAFETACGRCHKGEARRSNGNWAVNGPSDVIGDQRFGQTAVERLTSADPNHVMPPTRGAGGSVQPLGADDAALLQILRDWLAAGRSASGFTREVPALPPYFRYPDELRQSFTNLGSCIPEPEQVGCAELEMQRMDDRFAAVRSFADLPKRLEQTDLFSLDSAALADRRVISYAPTYTLYSDGAKKMRYVRVPLGKTIKYDPAKHDLTIPPNTRFYKTFLREVVGKDGNHAYRKVETRIILVRDDSVEADGTITRNVIFGSYLWSLDEARAELVELPYGDQTPFRDLALRHILDEPRALAAGYDPETQAGIQAALGADDQLRAQAPSAQLDSSSLLTRGYALPGRDRCIQCHMGSSSRSYIIGFNPYQVDRRPEGEGGIYDAPPGPDELSQLQRLIGYGVIEDVPAAQTSAPNVFKLEDSQEVKPRNEYELKAQAYMMGNCAFCHNPHGFPSVENPSLEEVLNFFPDPATNGGIFHFPLDTFSPRTSRGPAFDVKFPYITPSIFERMDEIAVDRSFNIRNTSATGSTRVFVAAPWRSLLFRNTQTPYTYSHDEAIHPHMPLNVAGYDARIQGILGDWMLSIPARLKPGAENVATYLPAPPKDDSGSADAEQPWQEVLEDDPLYADYVAAAALRREAFRSARILPYEEFSAACPSSVAHDCQDGSSEGHAYIGGSAFRVDASDVFAPEMRGEQPLEQPLDAEFRIVPGATQPDGKQGPAKIVRSNTELTDKEVLVALGWQDLIPDRPHFLLRDLTIRPGAWVPRRANWASAFASEEAFLPPILDLSDLPVAERESAQAARELRREQAARVYDPLMHFRISENLQSFASTERPYGLWKEPDDGSTVGGEELRCEQLLGPDAHPKQVKDFVAEPPQWFLERGLDLSATGPGSDLQRPVYTQLPGESFFTLICSNCHGKEANANSLLAGTILELTGGRTRVANLRDGLFGNHGDNRAEVFPGPLFPGEATDTMAVRYLLWMGLGGTEATIPSVVLSRVGATRPLGEDRLKNPNAQATPNMLANAIGFCQDSLGLANPGSNSIEFDDVRLGPGWPEFDSSRHHSNSESSLVGKNGDAELWLSACALDNPPPIRVVEFLEPDPTQTNQPRFRIKSAYWRELDGVLLVPPHSRFGNQRGVVTEGIAEDNVFPWCILAPATSPGRDEVQKAWQSSIGRAAEEPPFCPESLFVNTGSGVDHVDLAAVPDLNVADRRRDVWATRGAMNVGASVFLYLDGLSKGSWQRKPAFDACSLPKPTN